ncbi:hypothetical protein [Desulfobulbus sp.]|uniref:hypothetical protein n=1 Tax=Desulfobulbus sp. TaxID=895 RepID=UPI00286F7DA1|nr:hypothetical protein [Desulfobulbus sp.]
MTSTKNDNLIEKNNIKHWNLESILTLSTILLIPLILSILLLSSFSIDFPEFNSLSIKKGILEKVGSGRYQKNSNWITLIINGKRENIDIPIGKESSNLINETGNFIEIRYTSKKPKKNNIWHISSEKQIYFNYEKKLNKLIVLKSYTRNLYAICLIFTLFHYSFSYRSIKKYISAINTSDTEIDLMISKKIIFQPNGFNIGSLIYILSLIEIAIIYFTLKIGLINKILNIVSISILIMIFLGFLRLLNIKHCLVLHEEGIEYEPFRKKINTNFISWSEIENITYRSSKGYTFVTINLACRKRASFFDKLSLVLYDPLSIPVFNFENSYTLQKLLLKHHDSKKK